MQALAFQVNRTIGIREHLLAALCASLFALLPAESRGQADLLDSDWLKQQSDHFVLFSQESRRRTQRLLMEFEQWRAGVAALIPETDLPSATVPNYVYVFRSDEALSAFTFTQENAFFYATPRANFMAFVAEDEDSLALARHHYAHFLLRNFSDLRLPRWYEEGLAAFLARIRVGRSALDFDQYTSRNNEAMLSISESFSMERLLFRDEALASPRNLQIANLKSESLYYYLVYGYQIDGFPDRREALSNYLSYLLEDRSPRFAYDLSFDVTPAQLDDEFHRFLQQSERPRVDLAGHIESVALREPEEVSGVRLSVALGELALNGGRPDTAQFFFEAGMQESEPLARSYSGLGDALRFQDVEGRDQEIAGYFETALATAPETVDIVLDYGEYWEAELLDCDKTYPAAERQFIVSEIERSFSSALAMDPENPEVHLALGQLALLPERDWQSGLTHHQKAFALLPGDSFILEQAVRFAIEQQDYERADFLITKMAQPIHSFGEPDYVRKLRARLQAKQRDESYDQCADY